MTAPLTASPVFGVSVTVIAYAIAGVVSRRVAWLPSLVVTCGLVIVLLRAARVPIEDYRVGGDLLAFCLGPATVALGVPLYRNASRIGRHAPAVMLSVTAGAIIGVATSFLAVRIGHGGDVMLRSMLSRSVTSPVAVELSRLLGGTPELSAVFSVLSGLFGSVVGPWLLRRCGVRSDLAIGLAMGTSSHGIGTARVVRDSELQGGAGGLAMGLCAIVTSVIVAIVRPWLG